MRSGWSLRDGNWLVAWPQRVSQYDLVYQTPPDDPLDGLPLGNGDIGGLLWTEGSKVHLAVNKVDTWDDGPPQHFRSWNPASEEHQTALRSCGRLTLDFGMPLLDTLYLKDFEGRLDLATAAAKIAARSPFGDCSLHAYASQKHRVLTIRAKSHTHEPVAATATFERIGSRSFGHWYSQVNRDPQLGLAGTQTSIEQHRIMINQQLSTQYFVVGVALITHNNVEAQLDRLHSRAGRYSLGAGNQTDFTVFITAVTSENAANPEQEVNRILDAAIQADADRMIAEHETDWRRFWERSFVNLPDTYLANIWHLTLYLAASSSRGAYPPHFCTGLWGHQHDFAPWYSIFHWNSQWYPWQLHPADAAELAEPYYKLRAGQLPLAMDCAKVAHQCEGAFYADVSDRRGYQDLGTANNHTPGPQIAMDFWRHYQFTGDLKFLKKIAYPVMAAVARWYLNTLQCDEEGRYHPMPGSAYEGSPIMLDCITDLAMLRAFLPAMAQAAELVNDATIDSAHLRDIVEHLPDYRTAKLLPGEYRTEKGRMLHAAGLGRGYELLSQHVLAVGYQREKAEWVRKRIAGGPDGFYGIPDPEFAPVFPAGVLGLKDRGTALFDAMVTQVRLHPLGEHCLKEHRSDREESGEEPCMGWCPVPIVCARLGMKADMATVLRDHVQLWQLYAQGFGHYGPYHINQADKNQFLKRNTVRDAADPNRTFPFAGWPFRHFSNESMPIVSAAINEMLLQSHEGIIRVCPAVPETWRVCFTLVARGNFKISAEHRDGLVQWIWIESRAGHPVVLENPWLKASSLYCWSANVGTAMGAGPPAELACRLNQPITFATQASRCYLLSPDVDLLESWEEDPIAATPNNACRQLGDAHLGKPRMF